MAKKLKILLLSRYFPPEIGTAANLFYEIARGLVNRGHGVMVVTNFPWYNLEEIPQKYKGRFFMREPMDDIEVIRIAMPLFGPKKLRLAAGHLSVPMTTLLGALAAGKHDIIFVYSPPLFMGITGWLLRLFRGIPFVLGVQDLHPQCYIDQGILKNRAAIYLLEAMEKLCYEKSSVITVHSEGNREHIVRLKGIEGGKVRVVPNWIDTDEMKPLPRHNEFSRSHGLNGKFVVGYAGTLGMSQGLLSVIDAANVLKHRDDIEFFIVGDGIEKDRMIEKVNRYGLKNVRFLGMQPKSVYPYVVASSDVGLVTLNGKVKTPVVPSKILSMMAAGRPVLASMPLDGDAPKLIEAARCGICIGPENHDELAEKIVYLAEHRDDCQRYGRQGRQYVEENLSLNRGIEDIERIFCEVLNIHRQERP